MVVSLGVSLLATGCGKKAQESSDSGMQDGAAMQADSGEQDGTAMSSGSAMMMLPAAYTDTTAEFPRLRFADGEESLNDRCPVRKAKLNRRLPPLFVNGHPVGFC